MQEMREYALDYTSHLPNYICEQVVSRSVGRGGQDSWHLVDTVQIKLTYFEQHEKYEVVMQNNKMVNNVSYESLHGATSEGEFGSMMKGDLRAGDADAVSMGAMGNLAGQARPRILLPRGATELALDHRLRKDQPHHARIPRLDLCGQGVPQHPAHHAGG